MRNFDTVEEFWELEDVHECIDTVSSYSKSRFQEDFLKFLNKNDTNSIRLFPSITFALEKFLHKYSSCKKDVLIPCFNCEVVKNSIEKAGCFAKPYDFFPSPGNFDWEAVKKQMNSRTLAIIITHYFGVPTDFRSIIEHCQRKGIIIIEDCAHTLGGKIGGEAAGTIGDVAFFSFNYDKPISLGWGGAMIINNTRFNFKYLLQDVLTPTLDQEINFLKSFVKSMRDRRAEIHKTFSFLEKVFKKVGLRARLKPFYIEPYIGIGSVQSELGIRCLSKYSDILSKRVYHSEMIQKHCSKRTWPVVADVEPAWLKQKVRFTNKIYLKNKAKKLHLLGLRAGNFNWPNLIDENNKANYHNSLDASEFWMDIPIHQNLNDNDINTLLLHINAK